MPRCFRWESRAEIEDEAEKVSSLDEASLSDLQMELVKRLFPDVEWTEETERAVRGDLMGNLLRAGRLRRAELTPFDEPGGLFRVYRSELPTAPRVEVESSQE